MKVSILIATYNRPKRLARALESIKNQTYKNYEVVIVNDAGNDVSKIIVDAELPSCVTLFNNDQNIGPTKSFQKALDNATGDLVIQLDDDDEFMANGTERLVNSFDEQDRRFDAVFAKSLRIKPSDISGFYPPAGYEFTIENMLRRNWCVSCARMVKRSVLEKIRFDDSLKVLVDWDINLNLCFFYDSNYINDVVSKVHMSADSWHQSHKELAAKEAEIIRAKYV